MRAAQLNEVRRRLAEMMDTMPTNSRPLLNRSLDNASHLSFPSETASYKQNISNSLSERTYQASGVRSIEKAYELEHAPGAELMRTKYCIRHELGMCPKHQGAKNNLPLFLLNNGRRLRLYFDCRNCEMIIREDTD
jgi:putative protease